jgi:hypothetical protein
MAPSEVQNNPTDSRTNMCADREREAVRFGSFCDGETVDTLAAATLWADPLVPQNISASDFKHANCVKNLSQLLPLVLPLHDFASANKLISSALKAFDDLGQVPITVQDRAALVFTGTIFSHLVIYVCLIFFFLLEMSVFICDVFCRLTAISQFMSCSPRS